MGLRTLSHSVRAPWMGTSAALGSRHSYWPLDAECLMLNASLPLGPRRASTRALVSGFAGARSAGADQVGARRVTVV